MLLAVHSALLQQAEARPRGSKKYASLLSLFARARLECLPDGEKSGRSRFGQI
jgi:hypothetical protein